MATHPFRIVIPRNVEEKIKLGQTIYTRHITDGPDSPLHLQQDYNWSQQGPSLERALQLHQDAEAHRRQMEAAYEERNQLVRDIDEAIRSSRDLLKGIYRNQPHKLGDWGFTVHETPAS